MNIDTDTQWATWDGIRKYEAAKHDYLQGQIGNPEGDDKPAKYPVMFRAADLVLVSKSDLLPVLDDFDPGRAEHHVRHLASEAPVLRLSARRGDGLDAWLAMALEQRDDLLSARTRRAHSRSKSSHPIWPKGSSWARVSMGGSTPARDSGASSRSRVSAGSMTASISRWVAASIARPFW